jgi:hypothetical protein
METHLTKYFGEINLITPNEWYEAEIELNEQVIEILIACSGTASKLDKEILQRIDNYIDTLETNEAKIRLLIKENFIQEGEVKDYIDDQIENQEKDDINDLIEYADKKLNKKEKLLSVLKLLQIAFYPEIEDKMFAVFDYTIDEDLTDELLAIKVYKDNSVTIDIES